MKSKTFNLLMVFGLALLLTGGILMARQVLAQGGNPREKLDAQAAVGTAFTYQGYLKDSSGPVSDTCDFRFNLYDDNISPNLVAGPVDRDNVTVSDGYFSTSIDFGTSAFTGEGRQLQILVRCPAGSGSYTTLSGYVGLSAAPYALSLRPGAKMSSNATSGSILQAISSATSGDPAGLYGEANSSNGAGVAGWNLANSGGYAVYGNNTASSGIPYGVYGIASDNGSATSYGVYGKSSSSVGSGVGGSAPTNGVYGEATNSSGAAWGVYGKSNSPSGYGVYSDGDAHVEGNLTWYTKTSYVSVAAAAFHPSEEGYDFDNNGKWLDNDDSNSDYYLAPVQLPHGATVTKMTFYWWDYSTPNDGSCGLYRIDLAGGEEQMAVALTSGDAGASTSSEDTTINHAAVDNSQYAYYLWLALPDSAVRAYGVVIEYTITEPY